MPCCRAAADSDGHAHAAGCVYLVGLHDGRRAAAAAIRADMEGITSQMRGFVREVMESAAKVADLPEPEPQPTIPTSDIPAVVRRRSRP